MIDRNHNNQINESINALDLVIGAKVERRMEHIPSIPFAANDDKLNLKDDEDDESMLMLFWLRNGLWPKHLGTYNCTKHQKPTDVLQFTIIYYLFVEVFGLALVLFVQPPISIFQHKISCDLRHTY